VAEVRSVRGNHDDYLSLRRASFALTRRPIAPSFGPGWRLLQVEGVMRVLVVVSAALATLGLAAFGIFAAQKAAESGGSILAVQSAPTPPAPGVSAMSSQVAQAPVATIAAPAPLAAPAPAIAPPPAVPTAPAARVAQNTPGAAMAGATETGSGASGAIPPCDKPGGMGLERVVEIDTTAVPPSAWSISSNTISCASTKSC